MPFLKKLRLESIYLRLIATVIAILFATAAASLVPATFALILLHHDDYRSCDLDTTGWHCPPNMDADDPNFWAASWLITLMAAPLPFAVIFRKLRSSSQHIAPTYALAAGLTLIVLSLIAAILIVRPIGGRWLALSMSYAPSMFLLGTASVICVGLWAFMRMLWGALKR